MLVRDFLIDVCKGGLEPWSSIPISYSFVSQHPLRAIDKALRAVFGSVLKKNKDSYNIQ